MQTEADNQPSIHPKCTCASFKEAWPRSSFICDLQGYEKQCLGAVLFKIWFLLTLSQNKCSVYSRGIENNMFDVRKVCNSRSWKKNSGEKLCTGCDLGPDQL